MNMNNTENHNQPEELVEITPAQFFDNKKQLAIITVPLPQITSDKKRGFALITSRHERLDQTDESLLKMGYFTGRCPRPKQRWSWRSISSFLKQENSGTIAEAYGEILQQLESHIDLGAYQNNEVLALWIIGTYVFRMFPTYPYIHLNGMAGAGKTKTLYLVSLMAFNGCVGTDTTPAALVRLTHDNQSTLCLDEIEKLQSAKDEMSKSALAILNVGYKRDSSVPKLEVVGKDWAIKEFDPYSPKVLAGIRGLDGTLSSRCISIMLIRSENEEIVNHEVDSDDPIWGKIRDSIYEGVMSGEWIQIKEVYSGVTDSGIKGRAWEIWRPILAIAKHLNGSYSGLYERLRQFAFDQSLDKTAIMLEENSTTKILQALQEYFLTKTKSQVSFIMLQELLDFIESYDEETFRDSRSGFRHAWVNTRWLSHELRKIGLVKGPAQQRKFLGKNVKGFDVDYTELKRCMRLHGLNPTQETIIQA
jgi:hypothetical protein